MTASARPIPPIRRPVAAPVAQDSVTATKISGPSFSLSIPRRTVESVSTAKSKKPELHRDMATTVRDRASPASATLRAGSREVLGPNAAKMVIAAIMKPSKDPDELDKEE